MDGKSYVLENIIQNYRIKDEEKVTSETIYQILENTRITIQELKKCLGIPKNTYVKLRKGEKCYFICRLCTNINNNRIRYKPEERKILKQYIKNEYLITEDIKEMRKYITDDIRLMKILDISAEKYIKILNGKIKRIKNKIFDYQDKINIRNDIIKDIKNDNIITLKEVKKAKEDKGYTDYQIKESLGLKQKQYRELIKGKEIKLKEISQKDKVKADLLKIDIENLSKFGDRDYSTEEIMDICKEYNIGINTFIKEIIGNKKNPELTRKVLNISDGKIYLGKQKQISNELIEKIYLTKDKTIEKLAIVIAQMYGRLNNFEDLKQEVYLKLIENGGKIETNLSYDQNLVINVLMKGIKYAMFNYLSKNKFEMSLIQQTVDGYLDLLDIIEDNTYNPQDVFENSNTDTLLSSEDITDQHREFYEVLKRYSDILIDNREKGLEKIAQIFDISVETVMQKMIELQTIAINSQLVKLDSRGRVLLNEVIY